MNTKYIKAWYREYDFLILCFLLLFIVNFTMTLTYIFNQDMFAKVLEIATILEKGYSPTYGLGLASLSKIGTIEVLHEGFKAGLHFHVFIFFVIGSLIPLVIVFFPFLKIIFRKFRSYAF